MDALLTWIMTTNAGTTAARVALVLLGAGMMINQLLLAAYVNRKCVRVHVMLFIVAGAAAGTGALHSGVIGNLPAGAVFSALAAGCLIGLLLTEVGTPHRMSRKYQTPLDLDLTRTRTWLHDLVERIQDIKEAIGSDFGELSEKDAPRKPERHK